MPGTVGSFVHYGWIVVAAAFTVLFLAYGVQYAFGLFLTALTGAVLNLAALALLLAVRPPEHQPG